MAVHDTASRRSGPSPSSSLTSRFHPRMLVLSLLLFTAVLLALATAASRGLSHLDQILEVVDLDAAEATPSTPPPDTTG